ncbi:hypothetical protein [Bosea sp. PAMC 26642]|uniref:hypothetical protein n=1 Tax=Bosea sp. (strain PAMC 26642) TaxID=1792307 RepID=UPI00076FEAF2|nr:hypothetical protein [Bosea sp. PAMC 26642]AMJ61385.1 hypothetical protein AXW83_14755 [Bosea sp. PAMC 26642]
MKPDQDKKIARLTTREGKWWNIRFFDRRVHDFALIDLKTDNQDVARKLYYWWLFEELEQATISAPRPVMGMSVHRAISDFMSAPDMKTDNSDEKIAIYLKLINGFGQKSLQEIRDKDCLFYAESRISELVNDNTTEIQLREIHYQIRKELQLLRKIARYARRWQRIIENDMPDITLNVDPSHMTYRQLMRPIQTTKSRRRVGELGPWAYVQRAMTRRLILARKLG